MADGREALLVMGIGNPARGDDAVGPGFVDALERQACPDLLPQACYQLVVEDAMTLASVGTVVFVDACSRLSSPFVWAPVVASTDPRIDSHALAPADLLALTSLLYGRVPQAWLLAIRASETDEISEGLSAPARRALAQALAFFRAWAGMAGSK